MIIEQRGICLICEDVCAACGAPVKGVSDNGKLDVPAGGQKVVCLTCYCWGAEAEEAFGEAGIPYLVKRELKEMKDEMARA